MMIAEIALISFLLLVYALSVTAVPVMTEDAIQVPVILAQAIILVVEQAVEHRHLVPAITRLQAKVPLMLIVIVAIMPASLSNAPLPLLDTSFLKEYGEIIIALTPQRALVL